MTMMTPMKRKTMAPPSVARGWTPWVKSKKSVARLVPAWIRMEPAKARRKRPGRKSSPAATAVPTSTGTMEAGQEKGRSASHQARRRGSGGAAAGATSALFRADAAHEQGPQSGVGVLQALGLPLDEPVEDDLVEGAEPGAARDGGV